MKPIFSIDDFSQWISYDETENTVNGFNDLIQIDLKNINWIAMLSNDYHNAFTWSNFINANHLTEKKLIPDVWFTGNSQVFWLKTGASATIYIWNTYSKIFSILNADWWWQWVPLFSETRIFQNRLFYPTDKRQINSISLWSTWNVQAITANWTTTIDITNVSNAKIQTADKSLEWWTIYLYNGSWITRSIVSYAALQFVLDSAVTTWSYYAYIVSPVANVKKSDGSSTSLPTANNTTLYRPMIDFWSKLYIGDGDMIYNLDSTLSVWETAIGNGAISVWTDYMVKQIKSLGGYLYILADKIDENFTNTFSVPTNYTPSKLYIWNGTSDGFTDIIEIWTHCFSIEAIENKIYWCLQSNKDDGILFCYFNWSDFPTIAKFQVPFAFMPVAWMAYDRGRFYFAINNIVSTTYSTYIFSYSSYAIENQVVAKQYFNNSGSTYQLNSIDILKLWISPLFVMNDNWSWSSANWMFYKGNNFNNYWHIISQKYEITPNQFGQLVKWIQLNFKETMTSDCSVEVWYRWDETTSYTLAGILTSANQNNVLYGIMKRFKKIQLDLILKTNTWDSTPKIVKINLY